MIAKLIQGNNGADPDSNLRVLTCLDGRFSELHIVQFSTASLACVMS